LTQLEICNIVAAVEAEFNSLEAKVEQFAHATANKDYATLCNQVLAPASYTTPLVTPGGGCNFTGC